MSAQRLSSRCWSIEHCLKAELNAGFSLETQRGGVALLSVAAVAETSPPVRNGSLTPRVGVMFKLQ